MYWGLKQPPLLTTGDREMLRERTTMKAEDALQELEEVFAKTPGEEQQIIRLRMRLPQSAGDATGSAEMTDSDLRPIRHTIPNIYV